MSTPAENISKEVLTKLETLAQGLGTAVENLYSHVVEDMVRSNLIGAYICIGIAVALMSIIVPCLISIMRVGKEHSVSPSADWWAARVTPLIVGVILMIPTVICMCCFFIDAAKPHAEAMKVFKDIL